MERFARLASALGGTHPGTETVHRTVSMLRVALFESLYIKKEQAQKCLFFFWRRWRDSPASLPRSAARTRAPKQSTGLFLCFALPFSNLFILKKNKHKSACSFFGADGEIRTLAAVAHPTPLAGAPRHQLEYICKTVTITHTVKFNTD